LQLSGVEASSRRSSFKEVFRAAFITGKLTIVRIIIGFGRSKLNALTLGAAGISLASQANYLSLFLAAACSLGLVNGMMQRMSYTREHNLTEYKSDVQSTVLYSQLFLCLISIAIYLLFTQIINKQIFGEAGKTLNVYLIVLVIFVPFSVVSSNYIEGYFFSYGRYELYTRASIWASIVGFVLFIPALYFWGIEGAIVSIGINNAVLFVFYLVYVRQIEALRNIFHFRFNKKVFLEILPEGLVNLFYGALVPFSALLIRGLILKYEGPYENGYYQICTSITSLYIPFLTNPLWAKFFPEMSAKGITKESSTFLYDTLLFIVGASVFCILGLFVKPDWIIVILSSHDFINSLKFFPSYFLGDFFFNIVFFYSVYLLALRKVREYFFIWCFFFIFQYIFSRILLQNYHALGVAYAYTLSGFMVTLYVMMILAKLFQKNFSPVFFAIITGSFLIGFSGFLLWSQANFLFRVAMFCFWSFLILIFRKKMLQH
jgi:O-antigen/teichoic acid export membrane protein